MERQFNACQTPRSMYLSIFILQQFPSYAMLKSIRKSKNRYFYDIFVSPGDAPGAITLNVAWMEKEFDAFKLSRRTYHLSSTVSQLFEPQVRKNRHFHVPQPTFLFPLEMPLRLSWMEKQFSACQTPRSMYLSIFNSFRVIRCLSQCLNPKIAIFTTFWFPLRTPLGQSR